jgi:SAM-dependent methyltransferase
MSSYDDFAQHYDLWAPSEDEDVAFYVEQARLSGGPVVELGVGTGRVALPIARAGIRVIGIDVSEAMLEICRREVKRAGLTDLVDLRRGDFRSPPISDVVPLVTCPYRSFQHLESDADRLRALSAIRTILQPGGRFVFDVVSLRDTGRPDSDWIERAPGVLEKDEFDWDGRVIHVTLRSVTGETRLRFTWITREEWRRLFEQAGFAIHACYGWFDLSPCAAGIHSIWVIERPPD